MNCCNSGIRQTLVWRLAGEKVCRTKEVNELVSTSTRTALAGQSVLVGFSFRSFWLFFLAVARVVDCAVSFSALRIVSLSLNLAALFREETASWSARL